MIGQYIIDHGLMDAIEFSEASDCYKIKLSVKDIPSYVHAALRACCKETVTFFKGNKQRVRLLELKLLPTSVLNDLAILCGRFEFDAVFKKVTDRQAEKRKSYGYAFFKKVKK